jgi:stage III sporulation protein SpoIIIAA
MLGAATKASMEPRSSSTGCLAHLIDKDLFMSFQSGGSFTPTYSVDVSTEPVLSMGKLIELGREAFMSIIKLLPVRFSEAISRVGLSSSQVAEIALEIGKKPQVRFDDGKTVEIDTRDEVTRMTIGEAILRLREALGLDFDAKDPCAGLFTADNRVGVPGTLHRISAVRFLDGSIVGLFYHVGKCVPGVASIARDLLQGMASGSRSLLVLGKPGVGKTSFLRDAARVLAEELGQTVAIVDTSAEIAGGGVTSHRAVSSCRRLFVPDRKKQHRVMIEAAQNHSPSVVVVDEISSSKEVEAARAINQRGVALLGTARGRDLVAVSQNSIVRSLVGKPGESVFDTIIEIVDRNEFIIYQDAAAAVDAVLTGSSFVVERRWYDSKAGVMMARFTSKPF